MTESAIRSDSSCLPLLCACRLYEQLTDDNIPSKATKSIEMQTAALKKAAEGKTALVVLDGESRLWC